MDKILSLFKKERRCFDYNTITFGLISPEVIESRSFGIVKKSETINYRTFKPERNGLFCAKIFGPIKDYECLCGKYKRLKHRGVICEKCGVEVTFAKSRRCRMAHIELTSPVAHIWFLKSLPSKLGLLLDLTMKDVEKVLYFESYIILEPGPTGREIGTLLDEKQYLRFIEKYKYSFVAKMGAEAILELLSSLDLSLLIKQLREKLEIITTEVDLNKVKKRLKFLELFIQSGNKPEWMILTVLPVLPPDLRPLVPLEGGRFATSDLNDLYRRVINRNNRLRKLLELNAPDIIVRNEKRMLQESVDALFDNGRRGKPIVSTNKRQLKSLSDIIRGKQGRFRQNLLGKRVDYSGRSVIVVGPALKLYQCGLPKKMALELFKPFIISKLELKGIANIKMAKKLIDSESQEVYDILKEVTKEYPILLNRAPTLHRLGIQAFEPILVEGKAIQLHPLVCVAFNADFDGDQMAVHVPLSIEAQLEARVLMLSVNNILSPANGQPVIVPSQDILLGLYYLTLQRASLIYKDIFLNCFEVCSAYDNGFLDVYTNIRVYIKDKDSGVRNLVTTTVGRILMYDIFPTIIDFNTVNKVVDKKTLMGVIITCYKAIGLKETVSFSDKLMGLGFWHVTKSGVSVCLNDLIIPPSKGIIVKDALYNVRIIENQVSSGLLTKSEQYNKVIDIWSLAIDKVSEAMLFELSTLGVKDSFGLYSINSVYMMMHSGARGSITQMRQLAGMRGLMVKPDGSIIETPIISNFREGLNILQYFISTHGSRKGLADTALKTANSGYLTRRLVDVAQDVVVVEHDCNTKKDIRVMALIEGSDVILQLSSRVFGCVLSRDILVNADIVVHSGIIIDESVSMLLDLHNVNEVFVRSVITCESSNGVCVLCYGYDLSRRSLVNIGEAIGVIAAQSIGEPGTQLTMRTFHVGGAATQKVGLNNIRTKHNGVIKLVNVKVISNKDKQCLVVSKHGNLHLVSETGKELERYPLPQGAELYFNDNDIVTIDQVVAVWDSHTTPTIVEASGIIKYVNLVENINMETRIDNTTGVSTVIVVGSKKENINDNLKPMIEIIDKEGNPLYYPGTYMKICYYLSVDTVINVSDGVFVEVGDVIARLSQKKSKVKDITGGLPKVVDLFEARVPKNAAILAVSSGVVHFVKEKKGKNCIRVLKEDGTVSEMLIKKTRDVCVYEGAFVNRGEIISGGVLNPHNILHLIGVNAFTNHMVNEVQSIYRLQGVTINDKHIHVILRQMLRKVLIVDSGDTSLTTDKIVDIGEVNRLNKNIDYPGRKVTYSHLLLGITRASLLTNSFISAASFQETTKVLTDAALYGKKDFLYGLKENVIVGRLIPAGTGFEYHSKRRRELNKDIQVTTIVEDNLKDVLDFTFTEYGKN